MCLLVNEWVQFSGTTSSLGKYGPHPETTKRERLIELFEQKRPSLVLCFLVRWLVCQTNRTLFYPMIKMGPSLFWSFWQRPHSLWKYFHSTQAREMFSSHQRSYQTVKAWLSLKIFAMKQDKIERSSPFLIRDRNSYSSIWNMGM